MPDPTKPALTAKTLARLARIPGRHPVKDAKGLKLTVKPNGLCYWTYRYRLNGRETETSLGALSDMTIEAAIIAHGEKQTLVRKKIDPQAGKRRRHAPDARTNGAPTFGEAAEALLERYPREKEWRSVKHRRQWESTLLGLPEWFRKLKTDAIGPKDVYAAIAPTWAKTPETGSRLRGRIEAVLSPARKAAPAIGPPSRTEDQRSPARRRRSDGPRSRTWQER
jgi:hypothetical protein